MSTDRMVRSESLIAKWGNELFDDGISNYPQCFMRYGRRFVSGTHFSVICNILSYQYGSGTPYPSQDTIAENMGISVRRLKKLISEIEEEGNVEIFWRYINGKRSSSEYNFKPLIDKCLAYSNSLKVDANNGEKKVVRKKKPSKEQLGEQSVHLGYEQCVPELGEQSVPLLGEQSVPSNQVIESSIETSNLRNLSTKEGGIEKLDLPISIKTVLKNEIDRLIAFNISIQNIETHYKAVQESFTSDEYAYVMECLLKKMNIKPNNWGSVMLDWLNRNRKMVEEQASKPLAKSVRKEVVPDWLEEERKKYEEKYKQENDNIDFDEMRRKIEERRERMTKNKTSL